MSANAQIIPAILAVTEQEYQEKLKKIEDSGAFEDGWIQIDLMDNKFVPNKSIGPEVLSKHQTTLKKEVHLMVNYPENWIDELVKAGVERIIFPVEDEAGIKERIQHIKNHGLEVGLSVDPQTTIAKVTPFVDTIDVLLVMSVNPGFSGQEFIQESLDKIREAAKYKQDNPNLIIEVDGGINETVIRRVVEAGAENIVIGEHLIDGDIVENLEKIWENI